MPSPNPTKHQGRHPKGGKLITEQTMVSANLSFAEFQKALANVTMASLMILLNTLHLIEVRLITR